MDNLLLNGDYIEMRHSCGYVQVRHKGGGGVILQIAADDFMAACKNWLDHEGFYTVEKDNPETLCDLLIAMGYEVSISPKEPEIAPCPNPECKNDDLIVADHSGLDKMIFVLCEQCGYRSPYAFWVNRGKKAARAEAIRLHNLLGSE